MSARPLFIEFSRFACENKLTLSVLVNMFCKINKHIPIYKKCDITIPKAESTSKCNTK